MSDQVIANGRYQAKQVFQSDGRVIDNGFVKIKDERIVEVGDDPVSSSATIDLGAVALIPGLINAHTHLEFSHLERPLGQRGMPFTDWIKLVIADRADSVANGLSKSRSIERGIEEAASSGTIAIGEIATFSGQVENYEPQFPGTVFLERLTRDPDAMDTIVNECSSWLFAGDAPENLTRGISPHAPYSVDPVLLKKLVNHAIICDCPVAMHLAETLEEIQLINEQSGPFVDLLKSLSAWNPESFQQGIQIIDYLKLLAKAPRALVVHGNYLEDREIDFLSRNNSKMSIAFCPRTHQYFEHDTYPLMKLLSAGINVAVGTDSRASNPDLDVFEELKCIRSKFPEALDQQILSMGTRNGAKALGMDAAFGAIEVGQPARFNVVEYGSGNQLFGSESRCVPIAGFLDN